MITGLVVTVVSSTALMLGLWPGAVEGHRRRSFYRVCWLTLGFLIVWVAVRWGTAS